jgi:hypothetical protein
MTSLVLMQKPNPIERARNVTNVDPYCLVECFFFRAVTEHSLNNTKHLQNIFITNLLLL